jgi:flagellar biosynthesis chaperone FliJ
MNIPVYKQEIADGLSDQISNNSIACVAVAESDVKPSTESVEKLRKILAEQNGEVALAENKDQIDLYYIKSVLVSTGWNKNDDVFDPRELWEARNTPEDKPFNFMHDEKDIIGHITANEVVDFDGNRIMDESEIPSQFNILTSAVIYTEWSDPEQKQRLSKIVAEIEENKWFVSMECLFPNFDYALADSNGNTRVVKRDEATAFLTKYLRSYGGDGKYEDYKVGRLLRNLSFSGKGLVSKPANPRSIILEGNDFFDESQTKVLTLSSLKETNMSDNYETQISDLRAELAESKAANEALKDKVVAEQQAEFQTRIEALEATIAELQESLAVKHDEMKEKDKKLEEEKAAMDKYKAEMKKKEEELAAMKKKAMMMKRKAQLEEVGYDAEEATATIEQFADLDEATFDNIVAAIQKRPVNYILDQSVEDVKEEAEATLEEEVDSAEASEEVLEEVEEVQEVAIAEAMGEEDPAENLREVASEWIGSLLQSNKK